MDILEQEIGISDAAVEARVGDETVLLQRDRGAYYGLDAMGTSVWTLLKEGRGALEICRSIAEEYGVQQKKVEDDVRRFLSDLKAHDIIVEK